MSKKRLTDKKLDDIIKIIEAYEKIQYPEYTYNNTPYKDFLKLNGIHTLNCFEKPDYDVLKKAVFNYKKDTSLIDILDALNSFLADKGFTKKCKSMKCCNGDCHEKCLNDEYTVDVFIDEDDIDEVECDCSKKKTSSKAKNLKDRSVKQEYSMTFEDDAYQYLKDLMEQEYLMAIKTDNGKSDGNKDVVYLKESDFKFNPRLELDNFKVIMDSKMNILINSNDINDVVMYINYLLNFYFRVKSPSISKKENALNEDGYKGFIEPVLSRIADIIMKKYDDYGETNLIDSEKFGIKPKNGILLRINDKINRIHNLLRPERVENFESVEDSFEDAIGYCFLIIALGVMNEDSSNY